MQHDKPNESFHWKNRLDDLAHAPGEASLDKAAAWEKLHDRLREKPRKRGFAWYWMAAAVVIAAIVLPWLAYERTEIIPAVNKETADVKKLDIPSTNIEPKMPLPGDPLTRDTVLKNSSGAVGVSNGSMHYTKKAIEQRRPEVQIARDSTLQQEPVVITHIPEVTDTGVVAVITPAKKKLRVIHINDIDQPGQTQVDYARKMSLPPVPSKLSGNDALSAFMLSRNASDNIVKIKLSPSN